MARRTDAMDKMLEDLHAWCKRHWRMLWCIPAAVVLLGMLAMAMTTQVFSRVSFLEATGGYFLWTAIVYGLIVLARAVFAVNTRNFQIELRVREFESLDPESAQACREELGRYTSELHQIDGLGFVAYLGCASYLWLHARHAEDFTFWQGVAAVTLWPILIWMTCAVSGFFMWIFLGNAFKAASFFYSKVFLALYGGAHWVTGVTYTSVPPLIWVAIGGSLFAFLVELVLALRRQSKIKDLLQRISDYAPVGCVQFKDSYDDEWNCIRFSTASYKVHGLVIGVEAKGRTCNAKFSIQLPKGTGREDFPITVSRNFEVGAGYPESENRIEQLNENLPFRSLVVTCESFDVDTQHLTISFEGGVLEDEIDGDATDVKGKVRCERG